LEHSQPSFNGQIKPIQTMQQINLKKVEQTILDEVLKHGDLEGI
jgi:hypothetical protein